MEISSKKFSTNSSSVPSSKDVKIMSATTTGAQPQQQQPQQPQPRQHQPQKAVNKDYRVEHQFLNKMPDFNSVENDLMKLLNDFSETRLKKYGNYTRFCNYKITGFPITCCFCF